MLKGQAPVGLRPAPLNPGATASATPNVVGVRDVACSYVVGTMEHRFTARDTEEILEVMANAQPSQGGRRVASIVLSVLDSSTGKPVVRPAVQCLCESHPAC
jgi:hypothetical protein